MRLLPSGRTGLLVELPSLDAVLDLYAEVAEHPPEGVLDIVPAARTVLFRLDPAVTDRVRLEGALRAVVPGGRQDRARGELLEVPVVYDGADLE